VTHRALRDQFWLLLLIVAVVTFASALPAGSQGTEGEVETELSPMPTPESTDGANLRNTMTWNMCNGVGVDCSNLAKNWPAIRLAFTVAHSTVKPIAVATQEMCNASWIHLKEALNAIAGVTYHFNKYDATVDPDSVCLTHGNGIFWRGGCFQPDCTDKGPYDSIIQAPSDERRGWVCGRSNTLAMIACSTHLSNKKSNGIPIYAQDQQYIYRNYGSAVSAYGNVFVGAGDFNLPWTSPHMNGQTGFYGWFWEGDDDYNISWTYRSYNNPTWDKRKIDYIWYGRRWRCDGLAHNPQFHELEIPRPKTNPSWPPEHLRGGSDHLMYRGYPDCEF
jgi:hypothetical protein